MDKESAGRAYLALSRNQNDRDVPSLEVELQGAHYALACGNSTHGPHQVAAGGSKRACDLGDGWAMAVPGTSMPGVYELNDATQAAPHWVTIIENEKKNSDRLRKLGLEAQDIEIMPLKVEGHGEIPVMRMASFSSLVDKGMQVRDTKRAHAACGHSMIFGSKTNLENPDYLERRMEGLIEDCATIVANELHFGTDALNIIIKDTAQTPAHDRVAPGTVEDRHQDIRLFLFDVANTVSHSNLRDGDGGPYPEKVRANAAKNIARLYEMMTAAVSNEEWAKLARECGKQSYDLIPELDVLFESVKGKLVEKVYQKAMERMPQQAPAREGDEPPANLSGGKAQVITNPVHEVKRD